MRTDVLFTDTLQVVNYFHRYSWTNLSGVQQESDVLPCQHVELLHVKVSGECISL